jgi:hypothetical protein
LLRAPHDLPTKEDGIRSPRVSLASKRRRLICQDKALIIHLGQGSTRSFFFFSRI